MGFLPPPTKCSCTGSSWVLSYISTQQLPGMCLSGCRPLLLHKSWGNQNSRNPSLAGWSLYVSSAERMAGLWTQRLGPVATVVTALPAVRCSIASSQSVGEQRDIKLHLIITLGTLQERMPVYKEQRNPRPRETRRNGMSLLTPHSGEESPKAG